MNSMHYPVEAHLPTIPPSPSVSYSDIARRARRMEFKRNATLSYPRMERSALPEGLPPREQLSDEK